MHLLIPDSNFNWPIKKKKEYHYNFTEMQLLIKNSYEIVNILADLLMYTY